MYNMSSTQRLLLFFCAWFHTCLAVYRLRLLDRLYLPLSINPPIYDYKHDVAEQFAYDPSNFDLYVVGRDNIHVVSAISPYFLKLKTHVNVSGYELTDVEFCGQYVLVAADNLIDPEDGRIFVYEKLNPVQQTMKLLHSIPVGSLPDMVYPTKDCRTVIAVIEGEPYMKDGELVDPLGGVTLIRFDSTDLSGSFRTKRLDFRHFDAHDYESRGVRYIYKENGNTFAQDMEPEYITLNSDETIAYVALQENNAIATVDISNFDTATITEIYPLGYVRWRDSAMDASDMDEGINMQPWDIYGMYQPDTIKYFVVDNKPYILTMNEGDAKDYPTWTEELRGQDFILNDMVDDEKVEPIFRDQLLTVTALGRLKFSSASGKTPGSDKYSAFYSYGSRSFTVRSAEDLSIVWDSGAELEAIHMEHMRDLFNTNANDGQTSVQNTFDKRSDDKGPEPESGDVGVIGGNTVFFIGNERTGTIAIYSVIHDLNNPVFHSLNYGGNLTTTDTWAYQYDVRRVGDIDPEDIKFISGRESPILGQDLLVVTGSVSGTVAIYAIIDDDGTDTVEPVELLARRMFHMCDSNDDEFVTKEEHNHFIMSSDLNGDGYVSDTELEYDWGVNKDIKLTEAGVIRIFNALDVDNSGFIEPDDLDKFVDVVVDKDGNQMLTIDEWRREWRRLLEDSVDWD